MNSLQKILRWAAALSAAALLTLNAACVHRVLAANAGSAAAQSAAEDVRAALLAQVAAWNRGDIDGFMAGYWNDPALRFASGGEVTYGWQPTLERYHAHYPDRAAMGTLRFDELDVEPLAPGVALVFGRWSLERSNDRPHGVFTVLLRKFPDGWKITRDHTSAAG